MNLKKIAGFGMMLGGAVMISLSVLLGLEIAKDVKTLLEFDRTYNQALIRYADTNRDGRISPVERDRFNRGFLKEKGVSLEDFPPEVPYEVLTKWLREYRPAE